MKVRVSSVSGLLLGDDEGRALQVETLDELVETVAFFGDARISLGEDGVFILGMCMGVLVCLFIEEACWRR